VSQRLRQVTHLTFYFFPGIEYIACLPCRNDDSSAAALT
jgi:hypothetical protein